MLKYKIFILISLCLLMFFTNNCTLIGFGVGSIIDDNKSGEHYTINEDLFNISPDTEIKLITISKDTLIGLYKKTTNEYSEDYTSEYNQKYDEIKEQFNIPKINDTLSISNPMGNIYKYTFLGFDFNKIYVKSFLSENQSFIKLNEDIKFKAKNKQYLDLNKINNAIEFKSIPIMSKMVFENKSETHSIFYHQIQKIETDSSNKMVFIMLAGAAIDLLFLYSIDLPDKPGGGSIWK